MNRKEVCSCKNENYNKSENVGSFFLMNNYNNRFDPKYTNSKTQITNGTIQNINTDRSGFLICDGATKQQKLAIRHHPTPYRVPYNHYRKSYGKTDSVGNPLNCIGNEKIIKDTPVDNCNCPKTNYAISRLVNKFGARNINTGGSHKNYLQSAGKLYEQNAFGILPENQDLSGTNLYRINSVNGTLKDPSCKTTYKIADSLTSNTHQLQKITTATRKWSNPGYNSRTSVNSRNRTQRLKYNASFGGQMKTKSYNNCINGQECSKYISPGPNTKLFGLYNTTRCPVSRINGMKQSC
jgi:hypothetical protein